MPDNLTDMVRAMNDITSTEQVNSDKLALIIGDGKRRLRSYAPDLTDSDFENPTAARELLWGYVRYAVSHAVEVWAENYAEEILNLRMEYEVRARSENQE